METTDPPCRHPSAVATGATADQGTSWSAPVSSSVSDRTRRRRFEEQVVPLMDRLWRNAIRYTSDGHDADDLVQDTLVKAFRKYHQFQQGSNLVSWLFRIMHTTYVNRHRTAQRRVSEVPAERTEEHSLFDLVTEIDAPTERSALSLVADQEVRFALEALPEDTRLAVHLNAVEGFSYRDISAITAAPIATVGSRLSRGRAQLAEQLIDHVRRRRLIDEPATENGFGA
jgi:RNA polymerase sigma-70 factor (ECF subfamily)